VLNRPRTHNAINRQELRDLLEACHAIEELLDCGCVILRGEGPSFSSGADLKEALTHTGTSGDLLRRARSGARVIDALAELTPVTIAAVKALNRALFHLDEPGVTFTGLSRDAKAAIAAIGSGEQPLWKKD